MNILLWVIFGGIAGWFASVIVGNDAQMGLFANILVGIVGAFIGGWIADRIGASKTSDAKRPTSLSSFFVAVIGAILLLVVLNFLF